MKKALIFAYMGTFSLITPVGIAIGIGLVQSASNNSASNGPAAVLNGLAAGTLIYVVFFEILEKERQKKSNGLLQVKTVSPKRVVTIDNSYAHFLTISGHFFANHINIFHKTEVQWSF